MVNHADKKRLPEGAQAVRFETGQRLLRPVRPDQKRLSCAPGADKGAAVFGATGAGSLFGALLRWLRDLREGGGSSAEMATHTFGRKLNFNSHVHLIVSARGLQRSGHGQVCDLDWEDENVVVALLQAWSDGLVDFLLGALDGGLITSQKSHSELTKLLKYHRDRGFFGGVRKVRSRSALLKYYCRYLLRLAIAEYKIIFYDGETVKFWYVDTRTREKSEMTYTVKEFIDLLIEHLPNRYRHGIHYSDLLAPRSKPAYEIFLACLGKRLRPRPRRIPWRKLIYISYKSDPLRASNGEIFEKTGWWFPGMPEDGAD